jgi:hypothetical protein
MFKCMYAHRRTIYQDSSSKIALVTEGGGIIQICHLWKRMHLAKEAIYEQKIIIKKEAIDEQKI